MTRNTYRLMHAAALAAAGTGLVYGWMRYLARPEDPYALVNHPWQPHLLHLHILAAPALAVMLGVFWVPHALQYWRTVRREGRRSGACLWWLALPMIFSGYTIQAVTHEGLRAAAIWTHVISSLLWTLACLTHLVTHRFARGATTAR